LAVDRDITVIHHDDAEDDVVGVKLSEMSH